MKNYTYRKKPVIVSAVQWTGNIKDIEEWRRIIISDGRHITQQGNGLLIQTLEGDMRADLNDYIICGIKGELYPCKPDIFEQTYEKYPE